MNFAIPQWIWAIVITTIVIGLIKYAWREHIQRIKSIEVWKDKCAEAGGIMTVKYHAEICEKRLNEREDDMTQALGQLREWLGLKLDLVNSQIATLKADMDTHQRVIDDKIENKILKELRNINGKS